MELCGTAKIPNNNRSRYQLYYRSLHIMQIIENGGGL